MIFNIDAYNIMCCCCRCRCFMPRSVVFDVGWLGFGLGLCEESEPRTSTDIKHRTRMQSKYKDIR